MSISIQQVNGVNQLTARARYQHFIRRIADWEVVWTISNQDQAVVTQTFKEKCIFLWSDKEYISADFSGKPVELSIYDVMDDLLNEMNHDIQVICMYKNPEDFYKCSQEAFITELKDECKQYE
ncbi:DUF2750 domain-containing protein [Isobaculum melis]|uniref:DUF2750 domain-containing protein n=1 Tax=Isobaculum melis TaxID=142588 RepID=A0A1H9U4T9_9LACT|nr:DUF2750 domain-containing protein [Isobaculum melis]SES04515.1 Protein of unknown function [Isobaculum melis]